MENLFAKFVSSLMGNVVHRITKGAVTALITEERIDLGEEIWMVDHQINLVSQTGALCISVYDLDEVMSVLKKAGKWSRSRVERLYAQDEVLSPA